MFLVNLFKYRTQHYEHTEDFISSCLAELMRRDEDACRAVLRCFGFRPPRQLHPVQVRTQVRFLLRDGETAIPDLCVSVGDPARPTKYAIECKHKQSPNLDQIRRYSRIQASMKVALLATADHLSNLVDTPAWAKVKMASWQDIWSAVHDLDSDSASEMNLEFRTAFTELLECFSLQGLGQPAAEYLQAACTYSKEQTEAQRILRKAVAAVLPPDQPSVGDEHAFFDHPELPHWAWKHNDDLEDGWEADRSVKELGLYGLGLEVKRLEGVGSTELEWVFRVKPVHRQARLLKRNSSENHRWQEYDDGWWRLPMADMGGPRATFAEQCARATEEARRWLRRDLGLSVGVGTPSSSGGKFRSGDFAERMWAYERAKTELEPWLIKLQEDLIGLIDNRLSSRVGYPRNLTVRRCSGIGHLSLEWGSSAALFVSLRFKDTPFLTVRVLHAGAFSSMRLARIRQLDHPRGIALTQCDSDWIALHANLNTLTVKRAVERLADAAMDTLDHSLATRRHS